MKEEIAAAVFFVARLVKRYGCLTNDSRDRFAAALTSALFENYKNHWHPDAPSKGQAYRCLRMNRLQLRDPVLLAACECSGVRYEDLGLPQEMTVWVDPGEVCCRYGEQSSAFCVSVVDSFRRGDREFSRRIHDAVERASLDVQSGSSSDEEEEGSVRSTDMSMSSSSCSSLSFCSAPIPIPTTTNNPEPKAIQTIQTVSNPNSVYRFSEFSPAAPQSWLRETRNAFSREEFPPLPPPVVVPTPGFSKFNQTGFKSSRASFTFAGPRVDKYHWVSKSRS